MTRITPVLLSGGSGTRLWPLSREKRPKQLLPLLGPETMLQVTAGRVMDKARFEPPVVVARQTHAELIEEQFDAIDMAMSELILEPCPRNTAAAVALAALSVPGDALLLILPSDHMIAAEDSFRFALEQAVPLAEQGWIITFGIKPDRAETGYGYIRQGTLLSDGVFRAERFVEKPDAATAQSFIEAGSFHWNGGIFLFSARSMIDALAQHAPDILEGTRAALGAGQRSGVRTIPEADKFAAVRSLSIDHAVMERAQHVAVVPVDMGWSDIGSWDALGDLLDADDSGNVLVGDVTAVDTSNCLLRSESRLVVAIGVRDLVLIETDDAILVLPRGHTQRAKQAVELLRGSREDLL